MGLSDDINNFFNGKSLTDSFNNLKNDFTNFLNSSSTTIMNDANKQITNIITQPHIIYNYIII